MAGHYASKPVIEGGASCRFLRETEFSAEVVWLGYVPAGQSLRAKPVDALDLNFDGTQGERHHGLNRASCVRVANLYPKGTEIRNVRQLSVLSAEELGDIAAEMNLAELDPSYLGASIVLKGHPRFSLISLRRHGCRPRMA